MIVAEPSSNASDPSAILHLYLNQLEHKTCKSNNNNHVKDPTIFTILRCSYKELLLYRNENFL